MKSFASDNNSGVHPSVLTAIEKANILLLKMPKEISERLSKIYFFYVWNKSVNEIRLVTSWDTKKSDINDFLGCLNNIIRTT